MNIHALSKFFNNNVNLSKPFNENFSDTDLLSYFETPFNVDFTDHINISPNPRETNCEWYCNFTFSKSAQHVKYTILKNVHNHEINPAQVSHVIARYRRFSEEMIQDLKFFMDCKVAPITQLEVLKKKYPEHVFHKQDVYNAIYKLRQDNNEKLDTTSLLDILFEKISQDPR
uniref:FAR1 domain-containing protein n=1 Tax=Rhizophagus irregularis (strain DAOM 181602 / DAOM 197198 / MUCL 43194) TaxID=747089 RepID=U9SG03_RHIID